MKASEIRREVIRRANRIKTAINGKPEEARKLCEELLGLIDALNENPAASEALTRKRLAKALEAAYRKSFADFKRVEKEILEKGYHWSGTIGVMASYGGNMYDNGKCCDDSEKNYPPEVRFNGKVFTYLYGVKIRKESYRAEVA